MTTGLEGIKVVEAASAVAVPMASRLLGDWGADVIRIVHTAREPEGRRQPAGQSGQRSLQADIDYIEQNTNCNKRGMSLDLSKERGQEVIYKLLEKADVFLSNFRPRELEKFNLQYETLHRLNPRLICGNLTGFGRRGPYRNEPGFGPTAGDSRSGLLHVLQVPGTDPVQMPVAYADFITAMTLAYGVTTALLIRERTGLAQEVDVSLFNSVTWALTSDIAGTLVTGRDRQAVARKDRGTPLMNCYETKDGRWLYLMMSRREAYWSSFCKALGREDMERDPRFTSSSPTPEDSMALFSLLQDIFLTKTLDEWKPLLTQVGFPWSPLQTLTEVVNDPQANANDFFIPLDHPTHGRIQIVANPVKLGGTPETTKTPAPKFGQDTEEILLEIGYTREGIEELKKQGVIA